VRRRDPWGTMSAKTGSQRHAMPCRATQGNATGPHYLSICRAFAEATRLFSASGLIFIEDSRDRQLNASL